MTEFGIHCYVTGSATMVVVAGRVSVRRCRLLRDGLEMAGRMRGYGPIVVDLARVGYLSAAAVLILRRAADEARQTRRVLAVRNVDSGAVLDKRAVPVLSGLMSSTAAGYGREVSDVGVGG